MASESRIIQALILEATEQVPRFISVKVEDKRDDEGEDEEDEDDEGSLFTAVDVKPLISTSGPVEVTSSMIRGLSGPDGLFFDPPFICYHRDAGESDGSLINTPIRNWQMDILGRAGHPWAGNVVIFGTKAGSHGELYTDVAESDLTGLKAYFANFGKEAHKE